MNIVKNIMATAALAVLAAQPVAAANPAGKLSLTNAVKSDVRVSGKLGKSKAAAGIPTIAIIAGIAVIVGIIIIASNGSDSN